MPTLTISHGKGVRCAGLSAIHSDLCRAAQDGHSHSGWKYSKRVEVAPTQIDELWDLPLLTGSDLPISSCLNAKANSSNLERRLVPHRQSAELLYHVDSPLLDAGERACIKLPFYLVLEDLCLAGPCVICLLAG
jgi:hypothetical protein